MEATTVIGGGFFIMATGWTETSSTQVTWTEGSPTVATWSPGGSNAVPWEQLTPQVTAFVVYDWELVEMSWDGSLGVDGGFDTETTMKWENFQDWIV